MKIDGEPLGFAEGQFEVIAWRVHRDGQPYIGGTYLRETADRCAVVCQQCGQLPVEGLRGWLSDWHGEAINHVEETGHRVAVESWNGAIYGNNE